MDISVCAVNICGVRLVNSPRGSGMAVDVNPPPRPVECAAYSSGVKDSRQKLCVSVNSARDKALWSADATMVLAVMAYLPGHGLCGLHGTGGHSGSH